MELPLSQHLRQGTKDSHRLAERTPFIRQFFTGKLSLEDYRTFLIQLFHVYTVMEEVIDGLREDPVIAQVYFPELSRRQMLVKDLNYYFDGDSWRDASPLPATSTYYKHLRDLSNTWPEGLVAHHYTRYLGDLSGGQALKKIVAKMFQLSNTQGLAFYEFPKISDHNQFKDQYRARLDHLPVNENDAQKIVDEANYAFELNRNVFAAMLEVMGEE